MEKLKKKIKNLPIFYKLFLLFFLLILILAVSYLVNLQYLVQQYNKRLYTVTAKSLTTATSAMEKELQKVENLSADLAVDKVIQRNIPKVTEEGQQASQGTARREIYETMYQYYYKLPYVTSMSLYLENTVIRMGEKSELSEEQIRNMQKEAEKRIGRAFLKYDHIAEGRIGCARQVREVKDVRLTNMGVVYIEFDIDEIVRECLREAGYEKEEGELLLFVDGHKIYGDRPMEREAYEDLSIHGNQGYEIKKTGNTEEFIIKGSMLEKQWEYLYFQNYNQLFRKMNQVRFMTVMITIVTCILAVMVSKTILSGILRHIDSLMEKIEAFGSGKIIEKNKENDYSGRYDEIGKLHQAFDEMTHSVRKLRDENYDKQILLREAEIKMLEQQINPHFLYNTLDSINWMAQVHQVDDISQMARALGNIFRISISEKRELIQLEEELRLLDNYILIQKIRFREKLDFRIELPEDMGEVFIPKLCIQPLVENALKYALEYNDEVCVIKVFIEKEDNYYRIQISNTGSEFPSNLLEKLKHQIVVPQGTGVGIINIDSRLRLIYGDNYGLRFKNECGKAIVELRIPLKPAAKKNEGEEKNVTVDDCR